MSHAQSELKIDLSEDYRDFLRNELKLRQKLNAKYSLRDFAKHIGLSPSHLCEVLKGKKGISRNKAQRMCVVFGFGSPTSMCFQFLVAAQSGRSKVERNGAAMTLRTRHFMARAFKDLHSYMEGSAEPIKIILRNRFQPGAIPTRRETRRILQSTYHKTKI